MNMLEEAYREEILRQIDHNSTEIRALTHDYYMLTDDICKSQVKTFLEKKQYRLLDLLREVKNGDIESESWGNS